MTQTAGYEAYECTGPDRSDNWVNQFARATGLHTGWVLGYRFGAGASGPRWRHVRTEVEYVHRATTYDQTVAVPGLSAGSGSVTADKLNQELQTAMDYLGRVTAHTLFANLYWDVRTRSRLTPYAGVGVGYGSTAVTYGSLWSRNANPAAIATGAGLPNADDIRQNLAATTSSFQGVLSDRLVSQQVLFGVNYALTEGLSVGVKGRWVHAGAFESDEALVWDPPMRITTKGQVTIPQRFRLQFVRRPRFSWTRINGESDVQGGRGNGSVEAGEGIWVGSDGGSPEGDRSPSRRRGGWVGGLGARATVEREPEAGRGAAAAAGRVIRRGLA